VPVLLVPPRIPELLRGLLAEVRQLQEDVSRRGREAPSAGVGGGGEGGVLLLPCEFGG